MVNLTVSLVFGATLVPVGIEILVGPNLLASPLVSPTPPRRITLLSFHVVVPLLCMVTETVYCWPAVIDEGIMSDTYCALGTAADTVIVLLNVAPNHATPSLSI